MTNLIVLSSRRFDYDFRRYMVEAAAKSGARALHVKWAKEIVLTFPNGTVAKRMPLTGSIKPVVEAIQQTVGDEGGIVLNSLGLQCPQDIPAFRVAFRRWLFVFDVFDELSYDAKGWGWAKYKIKELVHLGHSDFTIVLSPDLAKHYRNAQHLDNASHVLRVPNIAADGKAIGIIASMNPRVDFPLIARCAMALPEYRIKIHGRVHHNDQLVGDQLKDLLDRYPNITYEGPYKSSELDEILSRYRFGLVPYFANHPLTAFINPDKYYHYLSAGMEVLTPPLPQAGRLKAWLHEIDADTDIRAVVTGALTAPKNPGDLSRNFSWDARWATLCEMTEPAVRRRQKLEHGWPSMLLDATDALRQSKTMRAISQPTDDQHNE